MQLISFKKDNNSGFGILSGDQITDLTHTWSGIDDLKDLLATGLSGLEQVPLRTDLQLSDVDLLPPIPNPGVIWCAGMNTHSHYAEAKERMGLTELPKQPMFFLRAPGTIVASGEAIEKPSKEPAYDYEGEIAIIIGSPCRNVSEADALNHVAGYSCFNDGSARLYQISSGQMTTGKNAWRSGSFGPVLTTADSVDLSSLQLVSRINGDVRQTMSVMAVVTQILVGASVLLGLFILSRLFQRQLGMLRAIGAPRRFVMSVVWLYGVALLAAGTVLGMLVGLGAARIISGIVTERTDVLVQAGLGWSEAHLALGFLAVTGFLSLLPALIVLRQGIAESLRS